MALVAWVLEVDVVTQINTQFVALNKEIDTMNSVSQSCKHCGGSHTSSTYLTSSFVHAGVDQTNHVNYKKQHGNPFSNTYNPGWRNHSSFSWKNAQNVERGPLGFPNASSQQQPQDKSKLEDLMTNFITSTETRLQIKMRPFEMWRHK